MLERKLHRGAFAALALLLSLATPMTSFADLVTDWNGVAAATINQPASPSGATPEERRPVYTLDLASVHVAIYDAVNAIVRTHEPYAVASVQTPTAGASLEAAVSAAAQGVLAALFPSRSAIYQPFYASSLAVIPDGDPKSRGLAIGGEVAAQIVSLRANDGRFTNVSTQPGSAPGDFRGTNPINAFMPFVTPFALASASQFRADGPPDLTSATYAEDVNEVQALGGAVSALRTPEQLEAARFHTEPPPAFWARNLSRFAGRDIVETARIQAILWVAEADAILACFESKYAYDFWRPQSAIPLADEDGNAATTADPAWRPVLPTPNHPEYPAAHGCGMGAAAEVLRQVYGTKKLSIRLDSTVTGTVRAFESTDAMVKDVQDARVWGGMHFRTSTVHGAVLGRKVAKWVTQNYFRPLR